MMKHNQQSQWMVRAAALNVERVDNGGIGFTKQMIKPDRQRTAANKSHSPTNEKPRKGREGSETHKVRFAFRSGLIPE